MTKMPVIFMGHGSPMNIIERNHFTDNWSRIAKYIPKPKAILCVSAHWYYDGNAVSCTLQPETIHDFYGFPQELYDIEYPAPEAPNLASKISVLMENKTEEDFERGLDHGAWSVLSFMYPDADIPVCQLSVNANNTPSESCETGQALYKLRNEGVLIIGSGNIVHNLPLD